ncbi:Histidine kinase (plasmid) [Rhodovastum atsumiense]|nr:Histidine kinase [Rhodovastum atsumiense]
MTGSCFRRLPRLPVVEPDPAGTGCPAGRRPPVAGGSGAAPVGGRRGRSLAALLVGLVVAVLLPSLAVGGVAAWQLAASYRTAAEGRLRDTASALASAVDREIAGDIAALAALASSPAFGPNPARPDLPALDAHAHRVADWLGGTVYVAARDGMPLLSTQRPLGAAMPRISSLDLIERVFATGRPAVGDLVVGSLSRRFVFTAAVPVRDASGRVVLMVGVSFEVQRLRDLLAAQHLPADAFAVLLDSQGVIVARSHLHDDFVGRPIPRENVRSFAGQEFGMYRGPGIIGVERVFAFRTVPSAPGWTLLVAQPAASLTAAWRKPLLGLGVGGAAAVLLGGLAALLAARRILRPIRRLGAHARALAASGDTGGLTAASAAALVPAEIGELEELRRGFMAAEAALRRTEARLMLATEGAGVGTWELDFGSGRGSWSPEAVALLGAKRSEFTAGDWLEDVHLADRPGAVAHWARAVGDGLPYEMEFRPAAVSDGSERWLVMRGRIERGPDGRPARTAGILLDVTARRRAEAALTGNEATLVAMLDALPVGVLIADTRGRIIRDNAALRELWGIPPETTGPEQYGDWVGFWPETGARIQAHEWAMARTVLQGEIVHDELVECQRFGTGERRFYLNNTAPVRDRAGNAVAAVGITVDVTERRAAEAALRESEARQRDLLATVDLGAFMTRDPDGTIRHWSAGCERLYGWTATEAIGRTTHDLLRSRFPVPLVDIEAALDRGGEWTGDLRHRTRDGQDLVVAARMVLRPDTRGQAAVLEAVTDVTAQRRTETALAESEARLRLALQAGRMGLWSWDFATDRLEWDTRQFELFGIDPGIGQPSGEEALARVHPDDLPALQEAIGAARDQGDGVFSHEFRVVLPGGTVRWIDAHGHGVPGPDGRAAGMVGLNFDVTGRREAAAALAASSREAQLAAERVQLALAAGAIIGTWVWELPANHITADERFARSFGLDPKLCRTGLGSEAVLASVHPEDRPRVNEAIAAAIARGGLYRCEYRVRQHDGVYRWIEANGRVDHAPDGTPLRFPGVLLDIERRRATEAERDRATALLRTFAEAVPGVVYAKDREGRLLLANEGTAALIGRRPEEFLGRTDAEFLEDKRQAAAVMANDRRIMENGTAEQIEEEVSLADGTPAVWLSTKAPLRNAAGEVIGLVGTSVDITARKQAEAVLAGDALRLEQLAERRAWALAESELRLAEAARMEALGRLAGGIAHDFNNVLQAVQGRLMLAEKRLGEDDDGVRQHLAKAADAAERGTRVTGRLLAFARRGELNAEPVAPAPMLDGLAEMLRPTLGADVVLRIEAEPDLPMVSADRGQLEAVLVNLANNARDAMPRGGTLALRAETLSSEGEAAPPGLVPGAYLRLSIADDGEGMPPEVLARVTEPFFTTKPKGKGTGLGLSMARGFAEQSGGTLTIKSEPGHGTTVSLWLPQIYAAAAVPVPAPQPDAPDGSDGAVAPGKTPTVLVVEDNPDILEVMAAELAESGFAVSQAGYAAAALTLLDGGLRPDAVVTDLAMPGEMDGLGLVEEARRRLPRLPAVMVTGHAGSAAPGRLEAVEQGGPFALVRKPAPPAVLVERLSRVLRQGKPGVMSTV